MKNQPLIVSPKDWQDLIGIQFALGGADPALGLNCYGLVREVYKLLQVELPERQETALDAATAQAAAGNDWSLLDEPRPYTVALIRSEGNQSEFHLGIVTPELTLLHALPKKGVVVSPLSAYRARTVGYYRYTPGAGEALPLADGSAGRFIGALLVTVAAVAATWYVGGAGGLAMGPTWGAAAGMATSMVGNMVVNAIAPLKPENNLLSGYSGDLADSRSYTWDGIQNDARQGLAKAMIFGRIKVGGQIISEKTWFDSRNNEYLDMLVCPGLGRVTRFVNIEINDSGVALYKNTAPVFRPGDDQQTTINMFNRVYTQYSASAKIPYDASTTAPENAVQFSTKAACSGLRLTVTAPGGIFELINEAIEPRDVVFRAQYRETGTSPWFDLPANDPDYDTACPFIHRSSGVFTGSANPYLLTDATAGFAAAIPVNSDFELYIGATTYYCTQSGAITTDLITFNAYTDEGRTTPLATPPADGPYGVSSGLAAVQVAPIEVYFPDAAGDGNGGDGGE